MKSNTLKGAFDLVGVSCAALDDDEEGYGQGELKIQGLRYDRFEESSFGGGNIKKRIEWCARPKPPQPQCYRQAARVLATQGLGEDARRIRFARAELEVGLDAKRIKFHWRSIWLWLVNVAWRIFGLFFGFGLKPHRALAALAAFLLLGSGLFWAIDARHALVAKAPFEMRLTQSQTATEERLSLEGHAPTRLCEDAQPFLYAFDVFVPLVDVHQESACEIGSVSPGPSAFELGVYQFAAFGYALLGWIFTSLALLTFSGVMQVRAND